MTLNGAGRAVAGQNVDPIWSQRAQFAQLGLTAETSDDVLSWSTERGTRSDGRPGEVTRVGNPAGTIGRLHISRSGGSAARRPPARRRRRRPDVPRSGLVADRPGRRY